MFINNTQRETKEERNKSDREQTVPAVQNRGQVLVLIVDCTEDARKEEKHTDRLTGTTALCWSLMGTAQCTRQTRLC